MEDTKEVLSLSPLANPFLVGSLQQVYSKMLSINALTRIHQGLLALSERYEDLTNIEMLATLSESIKLIQAERYAEVNAVEFSQQVDSFAKALQQAHIPNDSHSDVYKVVCLAGGSAALWAMMDRVKKEDIDELKDYINEQEEGFINTKNVLEIQYVSKFYHKVLKASKDIPAFVKQLQQFLEENSKKGYEPLPELIESCNFHKATLEQKLSEVKHREASFKFMVVDIMFASLVRLAADETTGSKTLTIKVTAKTMPVRQLAEYRDKSLLIMNSMKKNKEEELGFLVQELDALKAYIHLYEQLESILETYGRLSGLGYPRDFISDATTFEVNNGGYQQVVEYSKLLSEHCREWEARIQKIYKQSFGFCHFQGK